MIISNKLTNYLAIIILTFGIFSISYADTSHKCPKPSDLFVTSWAFKAMLATYNFNFVTYKKNLKNAEKYYTPEAWAIHFRKMKESGILNKVVKDKLVVSVGIEDSPLILKQNDRFWAVQMPLIIHYRSANESQIKKKTVIVDITRNKDGCLVISKVKKMK